MDFYPEGDLIWLEADVLIRQQSQGHRSLDDFCKKFYGGEGGLPKVVPYTFDDVVAVLNEIAPLDWRQFFQTRVYAANPRAPLGGIEGAGWRLVFQETLPDMLKSIEAAHKLTDLSFSGFSGKRPSGFVAPQSKIHQGYSPSSRLAIRPFPRKQRPS